jgi:phenylacetate-CoA ligase
MKKLLIMYFLVLASIVRKFMMKQDWLYKSLFAPQLAGFRELVGKWKAWRVFEKAKRDCPAYAQFVIDHPEADVKWRGWVPDMSGVEPTEKKNYVLKYPLLERCYFGEFPWKGGLIDESSGSSGKPNNWVRGPAERKEVGRIMQIAMRQLLGDEPVFFLNAFALGPWATGMNVSSFVSDVCLLKSIGPDAAKIITTLKDFGPKHRYIIAGYPPFLKSLVDSTEINWSDYNIIAFYGGEGISEAMRDYLGKGFKKVYGSYGASDLEINLAGENDFTVRLRKIILSNPRLRARFCKYDGDPIVFQYNPMDYLIETNAEGELIVTICRVENVAPKIRYNIHDRGQVIRFSEVAKILEEEGYPISSLESGQVAELPILLHYGRADLAVAFYGCKITPNEIEKIIFENRALAPIVELFALVTNEDERSNKLLTVALELRPDQIEPDDVDTLSSEVFEQLAAANQDFRESRKMIPAGLEPRLKFFASRTGPFANKDIRLKSKYIQETKGN